MTEWITKIITINTQKLHMRPTQLITETAKAYISDIQIVKDSFVANAKSLLEMIELAAYLTSTTKNNKVMFKAMGTDAKQALNALDAIVKQINQEAAP